MWKEYILAVIDRYKKRTELLVCKHRWEKVETFKVYKKDSKQPSEIRILYLCSECGDFKQISL